MPHTLGPQTRFRTPTTPLKHATRATRPASSPSRFRRMVLRALRRVGEGFWLADGRTKRLNMGDPSLELWRSKFCKGGRIVWQVWWQGWCYVYVAALGGGLGGGPEQGLPGHPFEQHAFDDRRGADRSAD